MPVDLSEGAEDGRRADLARALAAERDRLLAFGRAGRSAVGGFADLDERGRPDPAKPISTFRTCRMVYCFTLGALLGNDGDVALVTEGLRALREELHDARHGGWFTSINPDGTPLHTSKQAYTHVFVLFAAAAATRIAAEPARRLLDEVADVIEHRFWDDSQGVLRESFGRDWRSTEPYRGANSNMHAVEAFLAAADATSDTSWLVRADRVAGLFIDKLARRHGWRLPEHYAADLTILADYNQDDPEHEFRPYGVTPGHLLEWARLCLGLDASLAQAGLPHSWHVDAARQLYDRAVIDGWSVNGESGFVYTIDAGGRPVSRARMHWVLAEAIGAAAVLSTVTGAPRYADDLWRWWSEAARHFVDQAGGSWHHRLDEGNVPVPGVGKPDIYHPLQAMMLPSVAPSPTLPFLLPKRDV
jgi:mannose/cellobiose epimerase-like protein (N-acyl-D-glucosamine 2-epimerase family)